MGVDSSTVERYGISPQDVQALVALIERLNRDFHNATPDTASVQDAASFTRRIMYEAIGLRFCHRTTNMQLVFYLKRRDEMMLPEKVISVASVNRASWLLKYMFYTLLEHLQV